MKYLTHLFLSLVLMVGWIQNGVAQLDINLICDEEQIPYLSDPEVMLVIFNLNRLLNRFETDFNEVCDETTEIEVLQSLLQIFPSTIIGMRYEEDEYAHLDLKGFVGYIIDGREREAMSINLAERNRMRRNYPLPLESFTPEYYSGWWFCNFRPCRYPHLTKTR